MALFGGDPVKDAIEKVRQARAGMPLPDLLEQGSSGGDDPGQYAEDQLNAQEGQGFADQQGALADPLGGTDTSITGGVDPVVAQSRGGGAEMAKDLSNQGGIADLAGGTQARRRRGGQGGGSVWNQNYRYTNEDFYGQERGRFSFTDPRGVQLEVPKAGQLPMAIVASRMQQLGSEKQQTRKAMADLLSSTKVQPTADPYQVSFDKTVTDWEDNYIAGITKQYQGDEFEAMKEISTPGTPAHTDWVQGHKALDAIGQFVKNEWAESAGWIKEAMNGKLHMPPWMVQEAYDVYNGLGTMKSDGTGGDFQKLAKHIDKLRYYMNLSTFDKEFILPHAQEIYAKIESKPEYEVKGGKLIIKTRTTEELQAAFYDEVSEEALKISPGLNKDEALRYFKHMYPEKKSDLLTIQASNIPQATGGSGGEKKTGPAAVASYGPVAGTVAKGTVFGNSKDGMTISRESGGKNYYQVVFSKKTSGAGGFMPAMPFLEGYIREGKEASVVMHPVGAFEGDGGKLFIYGKKGAAPRAAIANDDAGSESGKSGGYEDQEPTEQPVAAVPEMSAQEFNALPDVIVPYNGTNAGLLEQSTTFNEGTIRSMIDDLKKQRGTSAAPAKPTKGKLY